MITEDKIRKAQAAIDAKSARKSGTKDTAEALSERSTSKNSSRKKMTREYNTESAEIFYYQPEQFLLGALSKAYKHVRQKGQVAILTYLNGKRIVIDGVQHLVGTDMSDQQIRSLALVPISDDNTFTNHIEYLPPDKLYADVKIVGRLMSTEVFFWNLGLLTCRGRVKPETPLHDVVYLKRWPNLAKMCLPPNALRIVTHWQRKPESLLKIFEHLSVPLKDIFSVYSAAYEAGLISMVDPSNGTSNAAPERKNGQMGRLFSAIFGRLKRKNSAATTD
ncbi:hypothetical protein [Thiosocius teredinicola]|uniref:hypothetical protein n=1 Tax=Thiosocius teredinicola TaxID=1973002 RepID=UPI000990EF83